MNPYAGPSKPARKEGFGSAPPYENVRRVTTRCRDVDVHELLKSEIYAQNTANDGDYVLQQAGNVHPLDGNVPPTPSEVRALIGFEDVGVYLDSVGKSSALSSLDNGTLAYSINTLNNNVELRNVISMRIEPFFLPRMTNPRINLAPTPTYPTFVPNAPDLFFYKRVFLQVLTLPSTQSVNGLGSTQFQWELQVDDLNSLAVKCTPLRPVFYLPRPLLSLSEIQFRFMVPSPTGMRPITLFNETRQVQMVLPPTNPIRFFINSGSGEGILSTYIPPYPSASTLIPLPPNPPAIVAPGVAIQMTGFTSQQVATSNTKVQDLVNNAGGLFITSIQYETIGAPLFAVPTPMCTFTIADIDGTPVTNNPGPNIMIIMQQRVALPMYFTCVRDQLTNHIAITHP